MANRGCSPFAIPGPLFHHPLAQAGSIPAGWFIVLWAYSPANESNSSSPYLEHTRQPGDFAIQSLDPG